MEEVLDEISHKPVAAFLLIVLSMFILAGLALCWPSIQVMFGDGLKVKESMMAVEPSYAPARAHHFQVEAFGSCYAADSTGELYRWSEDPAVWVKRMQFTRCQNLYYDDLAKQLVFISAYDTYYSLDGFYWSRQHKPSSSWTER